MFELRQIIVLLDQSEESVTAVEKAAILAKKTGSRMTLFTSGYDGALNNLQNLAENARDAYLSRLLIGLDSLELYSKTDH